jgi:hypothetical protein
MARRSTHFLLLCAALTVLMAIVADAHRIRGERPTLGARRVAIAASLPFPTPSPPCDCHIILLGP